VTTDGTRAKTAAGIRVARPGPGAGLSLAVLSAVTFGTSGAFASSLIGAGWSPAAAVITRIAVAAAVLTVPAVLQLRGRWQLLRRSAPRVTAYGLVAVAGCQLFYFSAIKRMPVGVALLLEYLAPVLVVGWLWLRHGQRPRRLTAIGAAAAIAGLALVLDLGGPARIDPIGVMWGLLAAVGLATYFLLGAASGEEPLPSIVMAWAGMCVGAVALAALGLAGVLPVTAGYSQVSFAGHQVSWVVPMTGLALVATVIAYVAGIGAARRLGAKLASFVGLAEVLSAILFAWLLLGQLPSATQFLGGAFILAGVTLVRVDELKTAPAPARLPSPAAAPRVAGTEMRPAADPEVEPAAGSGVWPAADPEVKSAPGSGVWPAAGSGVRSRGGRPGSQL
jgi:drug/metabolite transporter (DMT)-like permease